MPAFLKQFADESWFKDLYPDKKVASAKHVHICHLAGNYMMQKADAEVLTGVCLCAVYPEHSVVWGLLLAAAGLSEDLQCSN